jgi:glutamate synthase (NADPH/NADH) large chain
VALPKPGHYAVGQCFLPRDPRTHRGVRQAFERALGELGLDVLGWREVPTDNTGLGATALSGEPSIQQVAVRRPLTCRTQDDFERRLFVARKFGTRLVRESVRGAEQFYVCSMSSRTIVYKGMLTPGQLPTYYPDLVDEAFASALALIHSRFSTNVLPTWPLAHPFRALAHNGEINTLRGNVNWMRSREALIESPLFSDDEISKMRPITQEGSSDTAILDNVVEFLMLGGRSLPHVMMMLIPEAWEKDPEIGSGDHARTQGLLRVPRQHHRALGRPGVDRLHRRQAHRRHARPQRPAAVALLPDRRQPPGHGLGGRRPSDPAREGGSEGPPPAGPDVRGLPRRGPHHP